MERSPHRCRNAARERDSSGTGALAHADGRAPSTSRGKLAAHATPTTCAPSDDTQVRSTAAANCGAETVARTPSASTAGCAAIAAALYAREFLSDAGLGPREVQAPGRPSLGRALVPPEASSTRPASARVPIGRSSSRRGLSTVPLQYHRPSGVCPLPTPPTSDAPPHHAGPPTTPRLTHQRVTLPISAVPIQSRRAEPRGAAQSLSDPPMSQ